MPWCTLRDHSALLKIAIVPTACGIETYHLQLRRYERNLTIAIVPTACGIETGKSMEAWKQAFLAMELQ